MSRIRIIAVIAALAAVPEAAAQQITEAEAVSRSLARDVLMQIETGDRGVAEASIARETIWSNPALSYLREPGGADDEETFALSLPLELGGRILRGDAARARRDAVEDDIVQRRLDVARDVRVLFYELLAAQRRVAALERWGSRIGRAAETVAILEGAGEVSGYDRRRAERERLSVDAQLRVERARLSGVRERLAVLLQLAPDGLTVTGDLLPDSTIDSDTLLSALTARPDIRAEATRRDAAGLDRRAAGHWWIPSAELVAGQKTLGDSTDGSVFGVTIGIPLFDRNQAAGLTARADEVAAAARYQLLLAQAAGEVRARAVEERELRESAIAFRGGATDASSALVEIAEVAYRAGEVGILELLDAYRSAVDADTELIDLELRCRIAAIELLHAAGIDAAANPATETER